MFHSLCGLIGAFQTITIIPIPGKGCERLEDSLIWFPSVGLFLGTVLAGFVWAGNEFVAVRPELQNLWPLALGGLAVSALVYLTRGFHLDGLADMCDGFGGGWTVDRRLEIMRDSRIGSFGVIALILALLVKCIAVAMIATSQAYAGLVIAPILARLAIVYQASFNVYARHNVTQISMANHFIDMASSRHFVLALVQALIFISIVSIIFYSDILAILKIIVTGILVCVTIGHMSRSKVNGVTGDILGATGELVEISCLLASGLLL